MALNLKPLGDRVLVEPVEEKELSSAGRLYAQNLADYVRRSFGPSSDLDVWTSTLRRTRETALPLGIEPGEWKALDEIHAVVCDGLTYGQIERNMPAEWAARKRDKLHYRYPRGESYQDVVQCVDRVIIELERYRTPVLVIAHRAVLRALTAYFIQIPPAETPHLPMPLHTVIQLTPTAYGCEEERVALEARVPEWRTPGPSQPRGRWLTSSAGSKERRRCRSRAGPVAERLRELPGVERLETRVVAGVKLEVRDFSDPITGLMVSVPERGEPLLNALHLKRGRMVQPDTADEVVLADSFADAHGLEPGDTLAAIVKGKRRQLTVVGVAVSPEYIYQIATGAMFPDFKRYGVLWAGRDALAAAYDMEGASNDVALTLARDANVREVIARVDAVLAGYGGTGAYARPDQLSNRYLAEELKQLQTTATLFPAIFLGIAAFLLDVVVSRLVALQREQVAILKAFGYSTLAVLAHYVKLVLGVVVLGVAAGVALGAWFGQGLSNVYTETTFRFPYLDFGVRPGVVLAALAISAAAATLRKGDIRWAYKRSRETIE